MFGHSVVVCHNYPEFRTVANVACIQMPSMLYCG